MLETMNELQLQEVRTKEQTKSCYKVMHQLRPHLTEEVFIEQVQRQFVEGYKLISLKTDGEVKALAGFRILEFLAWGKVLYIDDLITGAQTRKKGYASMLLRWLIQKAEATHCDQVHLDSGYMRHDAHRFYLKHGFKLHSHHFSLNLKE